MNLRQGDNPTGRARLPINSQMSGGGGQWQGNNVFLTQGQHSIPSGSVADRLMEGNFGPYPNNTAPPGFQIPQLVEAILGSNPQQPAPQQQAPQVDLQALARQLRLQMQHQQAPGFNAQGGYFSGGDRFM